MGSWADWAEATDDEPAQPQGDPRSPQTEPATVDETLEARRLKRWLKSMFGGRPSAGDEGETPPG